MTKPYTVTIKRDGVETVHAFETIRAREMFVFGALQNWNNIVTAYGNPTNPDRAGC